MVASEAGGRAGRLRLRPRAYGRGAAVLSVGIGTTGLITYAYFSLASYSLSEADYGGITLLWSAVFITVSVLYRPVEQLLSRTIADRDARGERGNEHLRVAATIQLALGVLFAVVALALREPLEDELFDGSETLYWVLIVTVLAYAASYFARGFLAGHHRFGLYGLLVLMEASTRCLFALAVAVGIAEGQSAVALGMAAAPLVSLAVVPWALGRRLRREEPSVATAPLDAAAAGEPAATGEPEFTLARGTGFAVAVLLVMLVRADVPQRRAPDREGRRGRRRGSRARGLHLQRPPDRPRAPAAVPVGADRDPAGADAPAGERGDRPVPAEREPHADRDRGLRGTGRAGDARGGTRR